jgi:hypothetical protein
MYFHFEFNCFFEEKNRKRTNVTNEKSVGIQHGRVVVLEKS